MPNMQACPRSAGLSDVQALEADAGGGCDEKSGRARTKTDTGRRGE
jgi:hypothetical protein